MELPTYIDGFKCYAPEVAYAQPDFPVEEFDHLYESEASSFWFRGRQRIIEYLVKRFLPKTASTFLEIGCGTGFVLQGLSKLKNLSLVGAELHLEGLKRAKRRVPDIELIQLDATRLPFSESFDAIGAFDVVEHIDADVLVLRQMNLAMKSQGLLFLTVPQHAWLWSHLDVKAYHKRRYSRHELCGKLREAGFQVRFVSSFVSFLLPLMAFSRLCHGSHRTPVPDERCELQLPAWLDQLFEASLRCEEIFMRSGYRFPFGGSLVVVAQKC